jgi:dynein regulatory complex protein 1
MSCVFALNRERLRYNLNVLEEKNREQMSLSIIYKFKLNRLRSLRDQLNRRFEILIGNFSSENSAVVQEFRRFSTAYQDLLEKQSVLRDADAEKFSAIWSLHEGDTKSLVSHLARLDCRLHEKILGTQNPMSEEALLADMDTAMSDTGTLTGKSSTHISTEHTSATRFSTQKVAAVLKLIDVGLEFLRMDLDCPRQKISSIFNALQSIGLESQDDLDLLVSLFYKGQDEDDEVLLVSSEDVLRILQEFVDAKEQQRIANVAPVKKKKVKGSAEPLEIRLRRRREERKFWERISIAIPEWKTTRLYPALLSKIDHLHYLAIKRYNLLRDCGVREANRRNALTNILREML